MSTIPALPFRPDAVIFDMDGLMIDSERVSIACWSEAALTLEIALPEGFFLHMVGLGERDCLQLLQRHIDDGARIDALLAHCHALYDARTHDGLPLRPGILELLELLKEHRVPRAVATSTRQPRASRKLAASGLLHYFDTVVTSSDVQHPKPAPDIYLLAAQRLGKEPTHCLALEDSPTGTRAALAAGMTTIQIPDLVHPDAAVRALGHRIVESLHDVRALLLPLLR
ncbi:HAD family phosphatase [Stenotrophomonas sp. Betaine-02u-21]|uniref:HAD family hydrolase n=1 Tax=unclassified Stenotrophomonas TaxID=196198 RepID=UPI000C31D473|nr:MULTISPECIES: HAD family phosphatase [unclassified Stenotrophomonas]PKH70686.1 HAD family phosphatase [Stenotrophomonas sp. Betaine-02u-23]PKH74975.1 HAD family phosphatase [Stenotrophomonas sp. Betaine-02u-21]PKH95428.1 HAD family phosphatase [Stenotrophomonas sp. Bg11-02]